MVELDNLDVKILTHLLDDSRKSFQEIAKQCLTSVPTVKSRVDRLIELGVIRKFTLDIDFGKLGISEAILIINAKPHAVNTIAEMLKGLDEVTELYVTTDSDAAIIARLSGNMQRLLSIQDRIDLNDVNNIRVIPVKNASRRDTVPLASSSIAISCAYCDKKVTEGAVRKKLDDKDYFFCCTTCLGAFEEKYRKISAGAGK
ncbi:MAG TPA: winged helix-turn-helix transcriptional regulator [Candidatus Methanoperedens sp.]